MHICMHVCTYVSSITSKSYTQAHYKYICTQHTYVVCAHVYDYVSSPSPTTWKILYTYIHCCFKIQS